MKGVHCNAKQGGNATTGTAAVIDWADTAACRAVCAMININQRGPAPRCAAWQPVGLGRS